MKSYIKPSFKKITYATIAIFSLLFSATLSAQNNEQVLTETTVRPIMNSNKVNGKPIFENINSKFVITTNDATVSTSDSAKLVNTISKLPEVINCVYQPSKHSLVVKCKKQDETSNYIIKIKGEIVPLKVYITKFEEIVYTEKK